MQVTVSLHYAYRFPTWAGTEYYTCPNPKCRARNFLPQKGERTFYCNYCGMFVKLYLPTPILLILESTNGGPDVNDPAKR